MGSRLRSADPCRRRHSDVKGVNQELSGYCGKIVSCSEAQGRFRLERQKLCTPSTGTDVEFGRQMRFWADAPQPVVFGIRKHRLPAVLEVLIGSGINAASSFCFETESCTREINSARSRARAPACCPFGVISL